MATFRGSEGRSSRGSHLPPGEIKEIEGKAARLPVPRAPPRRPAASLETAQLGDPRLVKVPGSA
jgi:hypothetical protein